MSETTTQDLDTTEDMPQVSELDLLKQQAQMMGIEFSNNIGVETLRKRIADAMAANKEAAEQAQETEVVAAGKPTEKVKSLRQTIVDREMRLVRCRIYNMDPLKKDKPGDIFTVANRYLGTVRKFIPYGEQTDGGYHIPYCLYKLLKSRKFVQIKVKKDPDNPGREIVTTRDVREFNIEILDPLSVEELKDLAQAQLAAGTVK